MTLDERLEYMLSNIPSQYDTSVGSFIRDILYPVAEQFDLRSQHAEQIEYNTFAKTATGTYLDWKTEEQNITRNQATYAKGTVRIFGSRGAIVRQGAKVAADNVLFAVDAPAVIPELGYIDVSATCIMAGTRGNVETGAINRFPVTLPDLTRVTNINDFTGGYDAETDDDLRDRYFEKVSNPITSGNKYQYEAWAKEASAGVGDAKCIPTWDGPGTVKVVITNVDNQPADSNLIDIVYKYIDSKRTVAEAELTVVSATALDVSLSLGIKYAYDGIDEDTMIKNIETAIKSYFSEMAIAKSYISQIRIGSEVLKIAGVEDCTNIKINGSAGNVEIPVGYVPVLKGVSII